MLKLIISLCFTFLSKILEKSVDRIKNRQANECTGFFKYDSFTHSVMMLHPKLHIWERT